MTPTFPLRISNYSDTLSAIANSASDVVIVADVKRQILFVNQTTCDKTGYTHKELTGARMPILYRRENQARYATKIYRAIQNGTRWSGELEIRKKDGSVFWLDAVVMALRDSAGKFAGTIGIGRDLSSQRLRGQHEWESPDQLPNILDSMQDAVCVCDAGGKILMCNDSFCSMLGYRKEEIVGVAPPYPWVDPVDIKKLEYGFKLLGKQGRLNNYTVTWIRRDHTTMTASLSLSLLHAAPKTNSGFVMTARDVTDVQYVEEIRRLQQQIQRLVSDVQRKAERLQTLEEINWMVLNNTGISRIFKAITSGIKKLVAHDLAGIYVYDSEHESLLPHTLSKQTPFSRRLAKFPLPLGEGIVGAAAVTGRMVWVNNAQKDPRSRYPEGMKPEREHFVAVPLRGRGSIFGVLVVARNRDPEFIEEEALIVQTFADAATVALENARLLDELHRQVGGSILAKPPVIVGQASRGTGKKYSTTGKRLIRQRKEGITPG